MANRRSAHPLVELSRLPWWASVVAACVIFAALRWLAPALAGSRPILAPLGQAVATNAWWIAAVFLLPIPFALFNAARRRRLVDGQSGIDSLLTLSWQEFEQFVGEAYRRQGYRVFERGGAGADGGIDLELRSKDKTLVVQCKRWRSRTIGVELVRELYGAMVGEGAHGAIFVTSGSFTPDAINFARDKPIKLVDGRELTEMLRGIQAKAPSPTSPQSPATTDARLSTACPRCGSPMVKRVAKQGVERGREFLGCSRFPACRGTRPT